MNYYTPLHPYYPLGEDELQLVAGQKIKILSKDFKISGYEGWWVGKSSDQIGIVNSQYLIPMPTEIENLSINKLVGEGGFSKVYLGYIANEKVAVKVSKSEEVSMLNEGRLISMLDHVNIVKFIGFHGNSIVMEYCEGGSLASWVKNGRVKVKDWAGQICDGMGYLHSMDFVHRDLKSSNVLLSGRPPGQTLKITDFGLAREINHTTRMSTAGTYAWMSPEVIKSSTFSKASDVWSFGVLLWELMTNEVPYKGIEPFTIAYGIAVNKLTLPVHAECPQQWGELMGACWSQDPHSRPTFAQISKLIQKIPEISEGFSIVQESWRAEIDSVLKKKIDNKEKELASREQTLRQLYHLQKTQENYLKTIEKELKEKEILLLQRELTIVLKPEERRKRRKLKIKKSGEFISGPMDFRHKLKIQPVIRSDYFTSKTSKYWSSPNLIDANGNPTPTTPPPSGQNKIHSLIYSIGAMSCGTIGIDLGQQMRPPTPPPSTSKYYTYAGRTARHRTTMAKYSTEV